MDLAPSLWRCYVFCVQCARVHEVQDGPANLCPLSPVSQTPECLSYHMLLPPCLPVVINDPRVFLGVDQYTYNVDCMGPNNMPVKPKKGCCICVSSSSASRVSVMARRCEGRGYPITYGVETRFFCIKHSPPENLVQGGRFIDERQLMEFCYLKGNHSKTNCLRRHPPSKPSGV